MAALARSLLGEKIKREEEVKTLRSREFYPRKENVFLLSYEVEEMQASGDI